MTPISLLLLALVLGTVIYWVFAKETPIDGQRVALNSIAEISEGLPSMLVGTLKRCEDAQFVKAPFSEVEVLYHQTRLIKIEKEKEDVIASHQEGMSELCLEDESGKAFVRPFVHSEHPACRFDRSIELSVTSEQIKVFLEKAGKKVEEIDGLFDEAGDLSIAYQFKQSIIEDDTKVAVVGRGHRADNGELSISGDRGRPLFICTDPKSIRQLVRNALGTKKR